MKKKIMIVDDNPDLLLSIKQALEYMDDNLKVTCASSGIRCLKLLKDNEIPDLILLDIMMPKMSGWETLKNIQKNLLWKDIPIVFLTARKDKIAKKGGGFFGEDYIEKPFDIDELKKRIDKVLEYRRNLKNSSVEY
ncbi:MAG: response regulator transcription factor [Thermoplasmatales archaeon]|nr:MAG: response regulator transcription factor [Thermoplasmatales archaeon]